MYFRCYLEVEPGLQYKENKQAFTAWKTLDI